MRFHDGRRLGSIYESRSKLAGMVDPKLWDSMSNRVDAHVGITYGTVKELVLLL